MADGNVSDVANADVTSEQVRAKILLDLQTQQILQCVSLMIVYSKYG